MEKFSFRAAGGGNNGVMQHYSTGGDDEIWVNYNELTTSELTGNHGLDIGKSSPNGRTIQVSELL